MDKLSTNQNALSKEDKNIYVDIVKSSDFDSKNLDIIEKAVQTHLGKQVKTFFSFKDRITRTESGKFLVVESECTDLSRMI